jgi:hypothetical protein
MKFQDLALGTVEERSDYIRTAAAETGLSDLIIEKDFWVVWLLEQLFALSPTVGPFTFKGGTSLSKGFAAIQRFSEDIDISIGRATLGFPDEEYFYETPSAKETKRRVEQIRDVVREYAVESLLPALRDQLAGKIQGAWSLKSGDPGSIRFQYPTKQIGTIGYIKPDVLIEFGHADSWPAKDVTISPFLVEALEPVTGSISVRVLDPQRTFWEKATILHEIANRDELITFPLRYSRHYYDLARLDRTDIGTAAVQNTALLEAVVRFKSVFFASNRARYDLAKPGSLRLIPSAFRRKAIEHDYAQMSPMIFGEIPTFDEIIEALADLEARINERATRILR